MTRPRRIAVLALALPLSLALAGHAAADGAPLSPRLASLQEQSRGGDRGAVAAFWKEIAAKGTPLVEPAPDRADYSLVTFLWQGSAATRNVLLSTMEQREIANGSYLHDALMTRLDGSDVWYKTWRIRSDARFSYQISPDDPLTLLADIPRAGWAARRAGFAPDPLNPRQIDTRNGLSSVVELPRAPKQEGLERMPGVAAGRLTEHRFTSALLGNERALTVYTPPGYDPAAAAPYPLLIFLDASTYLGPIPSPVILDNLAAAGKLPAVVAVFVANVDGASRVRELSHNDAHASFLATELVPWARARFRVTSDPARVAIAGSSIGATAATFAALRHPEVFGNVLSQSGGYQMGRATRDDFKPPLPGQAFEEDFPEYEWLARQFVDAPRSGTRFYLEVGLREEVGWTFPVAPYALPSAVAANRHLRDVLRARGYEVRYSEFDGGHEFLSWRGTLGDGLIALLGSGRAAR